MTNTEVEEAHELDHEQAELVAKKTSVHGDTLDSGTATLNRKTYWVSEKLKSSRPAATRPIYIST
ncbi:hypothetical protein R7O13_23595 [Vibrio sp. Y176]|uniref:hypothetical protein n=1 Tax=Vibrio sp. Y176 TaxID=3074704 RepID=UPI00296583D6|nr:hypothetical protein [Vibrio sp. Y176]MDW1631024.1 hypothetical protein [Vibrio sp. Y176]